MKYKLSKILVIGLTVLFMPILIILISSYSYFKNYRPKLPNFEKGQIYPQRMQQPYDVFLTRSDLYWLDLGFPSAIILVITGYLNSRWKVYKIPDKM